MTSDEKAAALNALIPFTICFRGSFDRVGTSHAWYISQPVEVADGKFLISAYGNGDTPYQAIENHWRKLVAELPSAQALKVGDKYVQWNGFMWQQVAAPKGK